MSLNSKDSKKCSVPNDAGNQICEDPESPKVFNDNYMENKKDENDDLNNNEQSHDKRGSNKKNILKIEDDKVSKIIQNSACSQNQIRSTNKGDRLQYENNFEFNPEQNQEGSNEPMRTYLIDQFQPVHKENQDSMDYQKMDQFPKIGMHHNENALFDKQKTVNKNLNSYYMRSGLNGKWESNSRRKPFISSYIDGPKTEGFDVSHPGPLTTFNEGWNFKNANPCISPHVKDPFGFETGGQCQGDAQMDPSYDYNQLRSEDDNFYRKNSEKFLKMSRAKNENLKNKNNLFIKRVNDEEQLNQKELFYKEERSDRRALMRKNDKNENNRRHLDERDDEDPDQKREAGKKKNYIEAFSFGEGRPNTRRHLTKLKETFDDERPIFGLTSNDFLSKKLTEQYIQNGSEGRRPKWSNLEKEHFQEEYPGDRDKLVKIYRRMEEDWYKKQMMIDMITKDAKILQIEMEKIKFQIEEFKWSDKDRFRERDHKKELESFNRPLVLNFDINFNLNPNDFIDKEKEWSKMLLQKRGNICTGECKNNRKKNGVKSLKLKLGRVPYVLGENDDYVLVKFNREKKREKVKHYKNVKEKFTTLWVLLKKILWNESIDQEDLDALNVRDKKILKAVLTKKKLVEKNECIVYDVNEFSKIPRRQGQKRNEENLKCIFKYAQKFLRLQFRKNHLDFRYRKGDVNMKQKNLIDLGFYTYYFGKIADIKGWPIAKFFHPKVFSGGKASLGSSLESPDQRPKTINREYIDNLRKSEKFMTDISSFLNNNYMLETNQTTGIIDQYKEISEEKMMQKMDQWCKLIKKNGDVKGLEKILDDLITNDKCKLPWSIMEIERAVEDTCHHFQIKLKKYSKEQS